MSKSIFWITFLEIVTEKHLADQGRKANFALYSNTKSLHLNIDVVVNLRLQMMYPNLHPSPNVRPVHVVSCVRQSECLLVCSCRLHYHSSVS